MTLKNKVYVVLDNSVWNDDDYTEIVAVTDTKEKAKEILKDYVKKLKDEVDFDDLEFAEKDYDDGYVVEETEDSFYLALNGEYNSYHTSVDIFEKELNYYQNYYKEEENNYEL